MAEVYSSNQPTTVLVLDALESEALAELLEEHTYDAPLFAIYEALRG